MFQTTLFARPGGLGVLPFSRPHLDLFGLGFLGLRQGDRQDAMRETGFHLFPLLGDREVVGTRALGSYLFSPPIVQASVRFFPLGQVLDKSKDG